MLSTLVVAEIALALTLVAGAGWLVRSYASLAETNPGFSKEGRLVVTAPLGGSRWAPRPDIIQGPDGPMIDPNWKPEGTPELWLEDVVGRLRGVSQIGAVGSAWTLPLEMDRGGGVYIAASGLPYDATRQDTARRRFVSPDFFAAMGTRLMAGRRLTNAESGDVAVVNEAFVRRYVTTADPVGATFAWGFPLVDFEQVTTIVGVVEDVRYRGLDEPAEPTVYTLGFPPRQIVVIETSLDDPAPLMSTVRHAVSAVDPSIPLTVERLDDVVSSALVSHRLGLMLMSLFGGISLALAMIGIYGVVSDATEQRTGEFATRMALGASPSRVRALVLQQGRAVSMAGLIVGLAVTFAGGRVAESWLYEVRASDPVVLIVSMSLVLATTLVAFLVPAIRVSRQEPAAGLRH